jgi:hypothetical protein
MPTLAEAVLLVLRSLAPYSQEPEAEAVESRDVRLTQAAICITGAAETKANGWSRERVAAALVALGEAESNFAAYVHHGDCMRGPVGARCDPHRGVSRARGYWQQHRAACPRSWALQHGSTAEVCAAAQCAASLLQGAAHRCRNRAQNPEAGAFSGYAGISCTKPGSVRRAQRLAALESQIRAVIASGLPASQSAAGLAELASRVSPEPPAPLLALPWLGRRR